MKCCWFDLMVKTDNFQNEKHRKGDKNGVAAAEAAAAAAAAKGDCISMNKDLHEQAFKLHTCLCVRISI